MSIIIVNLSWLIAAMRQMKKWRCEPWTVVPPIAWGLSAVAGDPAQCRQYHEAVRTVSGHLVHV